LQFSKLQASIRGKQYAFADNSCFYVFGRFAFFRQLQGATGCRYEENKTGEDTGDLIFRVSGSECPVHLSAMFACHKHKNIYPSSFPVMIQLLQADSDEMIRLTVLIHEHDHGWEDT